MRNFHQALTDQGVGPRYSPIFALPSGSVAGVGVRSGGVGTGLGGRPPGSASLERSAAQVGAIDEYLRHFASAVTTDLRRRGRGFAPAWLAWRVGREVLADPSLPAALRRVEGAGIVPAGGLLLEVDAASLGLLEGTPACEGLIRAGVSFSVIDFGARGMSPSTLRNLPVRQIHVDLRCLSPSNGRDRALIDAIVSVADSLAIDVVADGVEGDTDLAFAQAAGIRFGQGYLWGSPGGMAKLVQTWARSA